MGLSATFTPPTIDDGAVLWEMAASCGLDRNSPYKYLLFCWDFHATSTVARVGGEPAGYVTGYRRPGTDTLFVWQIGVLERFRGLGLAGGMLDELCRRDPSVAYLEATFTPDNTASQRLFRAFADRAGAPRSEEILFPADAFPEPHEPEVLIRIGPLPGAAINDIPDYEESNRL